MTEADWLAGDDPTPMLEYLRGKVSDRKLRLFACECTRHVSDHLWGGPFSQNAVAFAERYADQLCGSDELAEAREKVVRRLELYPAEPVYDPSYWACSQDIAADVDMCAFYAANVSTRPYNIDAIADQARASEVRYQAQLLKDIFGNPFRPIAADPSWLTSTVVTLARGMYEARDFAPMPVLADALQDAGCEHPDLLAHCRGEGPHVRGCWVVDLLLGKG